MLIVQHPGGSEATRRAGRHLGDGKTTLCGLSRDRWVLPERRPRAHPYAVFEKTAGLEPKPRKISAGPG